MDLDAEMTRIRAFMKRFQPHLERLEAQAVEPDDVRRSAGDGELTPVEPPTPVEPATRRK